MKVDDGAPRNGEELVRGWVVERCGEPSATQSNTDILLEVWVKPSAYRTAA